MIRVGRFEADARDARGRRHLARVAWVPRGGREALVTRVLQAVPALASTCLLRALGAPSPDAAEAPPHDAALRAVRALLGDDVDAPLAMLPAPSSAAPRRLLVLWRRAEPEPFAVAKVAPASRAAALQAEAHALDRVAALELAALSGRVPRVLRSDRHDDLAVLVVTRLPGAPLLRACRLAPPLAWPAAPFAETGRMLGALHAATGTPARALVHGDAWSRNVLVEGGAVTGLVDWEACAEGDAAAEAAHFLVASARADVAGRATPPGPAPASWPEAARGFVAAWSSAFPAPDVARRALEERLGPALAAGPAAPAETLP